MRDHYRRMPPEQREQFAELVRTLATASEMSRDSAISVRICYQLEQHDDEGNCVYSESAEATPTAIQRAIPVWGETEDIQA
jgi:hypothetical protein